METGWVRQRLRGVALAEGHLSVSLSRSVEVGVLVREVAKVDARQRGGVEELLGVGRHRE